MLGAEGPLANSLLSSEALANAKDFCLANVKSLTLATGAAAALLYTVRSCYRASKMPPGPIGLPILGRIPWVDSLHMDESQEEMRQKYGDIYSYRLGNRLMIVVSSQQLLKEMLSEDQFSGRQLPVTLMKTSGGCGIVLTEGHVWSEQRRVSLRVLRDLGFARAESVEFIGNEIGIVMEQLEKCPDSVRIVDLLDALGNSVIAKLVFGRRYANEDNRYSKFIKNSKYISDEGLIGSLPFLFPYLARPLSLVPSIGRIVKVVEDIQDFVEDEIAQRESLIAADPDAEVTCLCDAYILERRKAEAKGDFETFRSFQLVRVSSELFFAGTDSTARVLEWLMVHMAAFPEAQTKVQEELHEVVGTERRPQMSDKLQLHFTQAVIDESMRFSAQSPNSVSHRALTETYFHGYLIPSDAAIVPFLFGLHRDPKVWKHPDTFYPEHFLNESGRYAPSKMLLPFGIGKRACPGESLAMLEIYLTFTAIMQSYRVRFSQGSQDKVETILRGTSGLSRIPGENRLDFVRI